MRGTDSFNSKTTRDGYVHLTYLKQIYLLFDHEDPEGVSRSLGYCFFIIRDPEDLIFLKTSQLHLFVGLFLGKVKFVYRDS